MRTRSARGAVETAAAGVAAAPSVTPQVDREVYSEEWEYEHADPCEGDLVADLPAPLAEGVTRGKWPSAVADLDVVSHPPLSAEC